MFDHTKILGLTAAVGALFGSACNRVDDVDGSVHVPPFADLDTNDDGQLSPSETQSAPELAEIFAVADIDQNSQISVPEYSHATLEGVAVSAEAAAGYRFEILDTDENQRLSSTELEALPILAEALTSFDDNRSGDLDPAEYDRALESGFMPH